MTLSAIDHFLSTYRDYAILLSILINIFISIVGVIPSWFLTAINVKLFGIAGGFILSYIGEIIGTMVSFVLYRKGLRNRFVSNSIKFKMLHKLLNLEGKEAFYGVLLLRLIPFIPSSIITLFAAFGRISWRSFFLASLIGKLPVVLLESISVNEILNFTLVGKIMLGVLIIGLIYYSLKKRLNLFEKNN